MKTTVTLQRAKGRVDFHHAEAAEIDWNRVSPLPAVTACEKVDKAPSTVIRAVADTRTLHLRFDCELEDQARLCPSRPRAALDEIEHAFVDLFPGNDPTDCLHFQADHKGLRACTRIRHMSGEPYNDDSVCDEWLTSTSQPCDSAWRVYHGSTASAWWVEFVLPWSILDLAGPPPTLGLVVGRVYATGDPGAPLDTACWPARNEPTTEGLRNFGELVVGPECGAPERIELGPLRFGKSTGRIVFGSEWLVPPRFVVARALDPEGRTVAERRTTVPDDTGAMQFSWDLDRAISSYLDPFTPPRLRIEVLDSAGSILYTTTLPVDRHLGICVDEPYGSDVQSADGGVPSSAGRPTGASRDAWLKQAVRALPRLRRANTQDGAPSDFCLLDDDGSVAANLMADDAWERLAAIVEERFASTEERLVGALMLVAQKSVTNLILSPMFFDADGRHTYHSPTHELMGPLSTLRFGGGPAVSRAAVLARLLQAVRDPSTDAPFVTRVVSLTREGGPRRVTRRYAGCRNLAPFVQAPGRVGVVAVEYRGSRTLLDPTLPACFVANEDCLATVEELVADDAIRTDGAGRLSPIYAALDTGELLRQPVDQLLSRGVFPELCPDEASPDRPMDVRARQAGPILLAETAAQEGDECEFGTGPSDVRRGAVRIRVVEDELCVEVRVTGAVPGRLTPRERTMERIHLLVDGEHGHARFLHCSAALSGERAGWRESAAAIQTLFKHLATENWVEDAALAETEWMVRIVEAEEGYAATFRIPALTLGWSGVPPVFGLNVWLEGCVPHYEQVLLAPARFRLPADPFSFADVYTSGTDVVLETIDFGIWHWGPNEGHVALRNSGPRDRRVKLWAETHLAMQRRQIRCEPVEVLVPEGGSAGVSFPYQLDPSEKMNSGRGQCLVLTAKEEDTEVFRGTWEVTYCTAPGVYHRFGPAAALGPVPAADDPAFMERKVAAICARIPVFDCLTTRDGAASDFVIRARDGSVEFNLMDEQTLEQMARYIERCFDNDLDRVLGMLYLTLNPAVARHSSAGHRFNKGCGPLALMRLYHAGGGGNCGYHSRVFAGLASCLRIGGRPLAAHTTGVWGHCIAAVEWKGAKALLDPDVGHIFLTRDGRDLASFDALCRGTPILTTAGEGEMGRFLTANPLTP